MLAKRNFAELSNIPGDETLPGGKSISKVSKGTIDASDFQCSICFELLIDPVVGLCGHDYCKRCVEGWSKSKTQAGYPVECPTCRTPFVDTNVENLAVCTRLKNVIEKLFFNEVIIKKRRIEEAALDEKQFHRSDGFAMPWTNSGSSPSLPLPATSAAPLRQQPQPSSLPGLLEGMPAPFMQLSTDNDGPALQANASIRSVGAHGHRSPQDQADALRLGDQDNRLALASPGGPAAQEPMSNPHVRQAYIQQQQTWLLFMRHAAKCNEVDCNLGATCRMVKDLWQHMLTCTNAGCMYRKCISSRDLLKHHIRCQDTNCPICTPVRDYIQRSRMPQQPSGQGHFDGQLHPHGSAEPGLTNHRTLSMPGMHPAQSRGVGQHPNDLLAPNMSNHAMPSPTQLVPSLPPPHPGGMGNSYPQAPGRPMPSTQMNPATRGRPIRPHPHTYGLPGPVPANGLSLSDMGNQSGRHMMPMGMHSMGSGGLPGLVSEDVAERGGSGIGMMGLPGDPQLAATMPL